VSRNTRPAVPTMVDRLTRAGTRPLAIHKPNADGAKYGIPKAFRRYSKRYGKGVLEMVKTHLKCPAEKL
jgi:hypothetical protein